MKKNLILVFAAVVGLLMAGCSGEDAIKIHNVESVSISIIGGMKANTLVRVENASASKVKVSGAKLTVTDRAGNVLGNAWVEEELEVPRRSTTDIMIPVRFSLTDPITGLRMLRNINSMTDNMLVTGEAVLKRGGIKHKVNVKNMPLSKILSKFDGELDPASLIKI